MNSPYGSPPIYDYGEEWLDPGWCDWSAVGGTFDDIDTLDLTCGETNNAQYTGPSRYPVTQDTFWDSGQQGWSQHTEARHDSVPQAGSSPADETANLNTLFSTPVGPKVDPRFAVNDERIQQQRARFDGDQYTAAWTRGQGTDRAGWCGFCSTWHKMKDSAYWYHMHYSHGISYATGQPFQPPKATQWNDKSNSVKVQCATCDEWLILGSGSRARTSYFRHAYKCEAKKSGGRTSSSRSRSSPTK
ncbi:uncharacterized protein LTR77_002454 [Saxophila tyrrhenica]|uniref:Transcription regulator Rua1 C-terminal domain-containing protein n=1 Tax=Saxophila tyrrhenica TaxID=1690608 RepID=A0AAV9PM47_9PEZI|nr:hypothetical protein LTR77_002454 [Saxophila tyrrhenica]